MRVEMVGWRFEHSGWVAYEMSFLLVDGDGMAMMRMSVSEVWGKS